MFTRTALLPLLSIAVLLGISTQAPAETYKVTTTADEGRGSLREAIENANRHDGPDVVVFAIQGAGVRSIKPMTALPVIRDPLVIDGFSQTRARRNSLRDGSDSLLLIELDGSSLKDNSACGITIHTSNTTIRGLVINRFPKHGILVKGESNNAIEGNYIGTDSTGTGDLGNREDGIHVDGSSKNRIGGLSPELRNIISGNDNDGIHITGEESSFNQVIGNFIGLDVFGTSELGNGDNGVLSESPDNQIGGTIPGSRNVISANHGCGVEFEHLTAKRNKLQENFIGTDVTGLSDIGNRKMGLEVVNSPSNLIERNIISGNHADGIHLVGAGTKQNSVHGNLIGLSRDGKTDLGNARDGVRITDASSNVIGGTGPGEQNVISGNAANGVYILGETSTKNTVLGNLIGTDSSGLMAVANDDNGVLSQSPGNVIGAIGGRNVISGNAGCGVEFENPTAKGNILVANYIGTDVTGSRALPNRKMGLEIVNSPQNVVGGTRSGEGNLISGNISDGIHLVGAQTKGNTFQGNIIGLDRSGKSDLGNGRDGIRVTDASENTIGGHDENAGNVVSGNDANGIHVLGEAASNNKILGNLVGTDLSGTHGISNNDNGVLSESPGNVIGGREAGSRNVISGNGGCGVEFEHRTAKGNVLIGNYVGTDITGSVALPNRKMGLEVVNAAASIVTKNVISGNNSDGIHLVGAATTESSIRGNLIGTDKSGRFPLGNRRDGIRITDSPRNTVGGEREEDGNIISANGSDGIRILGAKASGNRVLGNYIGVNVFGGNIVNRLNGIHVNNGLDVDLSGNKSTESVLRNKSSLVSTEPD